MGHRTWAPWRGKPLVVAVVEEYLQGGGYCAISNGSTFLSSSSDNQNLPLCVLVSSRPDDVDGKAVLGLGDGRVGRGES